MKCRLNGIEHPVRISTRGHWHSSQSLKKQAQTVGCPELVKNRKGGHHPCHCLRFGMVFSYLKDIALESNWGNWLWQRTKGPSPD